MATVSAECFSITLTLPAFPPRVDDIEAALQLELGSNVLLNWAITEAHPDTRQVRVEGAWLPHSVENALK